MVCSAQHSTPATTSDNPTARCREALSFGEHYCVNEPESGSSVPAAEPFSRCAAALQPPVGAIFQSPSPGALFDTAGSWQRRQQGFKECCYAWCSLAPPNTGLQGGKH